MRLFIAVPVTDTVKDVLVLVQKRLKPAKMTLVKKGALHITMKFLDEVSESKVEETKKRLSGVQFAACGGRLDGLGVFPNQYKPSVVWAGVQPAEKIIALQQKIEQSLAGLFPKDERFHVHITLARVKFIRNKKEFKELLKNISVPPAEFDINSFELVSSMLTKEGPVYETVGIYHSNL